MNQDKLVSFRLSQDITEALAAIKERDGIPVGEQLRRAAKLWIAEKQVTLKPRTKKAGR